MKLYLSGFPSVCVAGVALLGVLDVCVLGDNALAAYHMGLAVFMLLWLGELR